MDMEHLNNRWWLPEALLVAAHEIRLSTPEDEFFCKNMYQPVIEAISAAEFAKRRPWDKNWQVRLIARNERFPDVKLKCGDDIRQFEIVEADMVNRRRCAEYIESKYKPSQLEYSNLEQEERMALVEIERVLRLKAKKRYKPKPNILVYVNLSESEPTQLYANELYQEFGESFPSVWLLWGSGTFRLWPNSAKIKLS